MKKFLKKYLPIVLSVSLIFGSVAYWQFSSPTIARAAITVGTVTTGNNGNFTATVDSGANALVVLIGTHQGTVSGVTYGGVSMTQVGSGCSAFNECGYIYLLLAPSVGTGTVVVSRGGGSWHGAAAVSLSGVKQTYTVTNSSLNNSSCSGCTLAITPSSDNNLILSAIGAEASATAVQTNIASLGSQSFEQMGSEYFAQGTAGSQTMQFNLSSGQRAGMTDVALEPAPSAVVSAPKLLLQNSQTTIQNGSVTVTGF